jgi:hypothetical protein
MARLAVSAHQADAEHIWFSIDPTAARFWCRAAGRTTSLIL